MEIYISIVSVILYFMIIVGGGYCSVRMQLKELKNRSKK